MTFSPAFQRNAFQDNAFQVGEDNAGASGGGAGGYIPQLPGRDYKQAKELQLALRKSIARAVDPQQIEVAQEVIQRLEEIVARVKAPLSANDNTFAAMRLRRLEEDAFVLIVLMSEV